MILDSGLFLWPTLKVTALLITYFWQPWLATQERLSKQRQFETPPRGVGTASQLVPPDFNRRLRSAQKADFDVSSAHTVYIDIDRRHFFVSPAVFHRVPMHSGGPKPLRSFQVIKVIPSIINRQLGSVLNSFMALIFPVLCRVQFYIFILVLTRPTLPSIPPGSVFGIWVVIHVITWITNVATIKRQTRTAYGC